MVAEGKSSRVSSWTVRRSRFMSPALLGPDPAPDGRVGRWE